jgi:hypothetical protein
VNSGQRPATERLDTGSRRWALLAAVALVVAWAIPAQGGNWNQNAHYALVRALAEGSPNIDRSRSEVGEYTGDVSFFHGHQYAAKAPGLAFWTLPAFLGLKAIGGAKPDGNLFRILWLLGLWATILPAMILLLLVKGVADQIAPGYGTITATTLGVATVILPFTTLFFAHVLTATLGFASFALLWRERLRHRLPALAGAGLLAGLAITVELPSVILAALLGCYLLAQERRVTRVLGFGAGVLVGVVPLLIFNQWAFGSVSHVSYAGVTGGLNQHGFYGVGIPRLDAATALLFSTVGLVRVAPVLALAGVGVLLLHRSGRRLEAFLITSLFLAYLVFNSGYESPFGGSTPGPRFLVPVVPFLVLPLALVYERFPVTTLLLAAMAAFQMIVITMTVPILAFFGGWFARLWARDLTHTAFGFGAHSARALPLFALLLLVAAVCAILATPRPSLSRLDVSQASLALLTWLAIAIEGPNLIYRGDARLFLLYAAVATAVAITFFVPRVLFQAPARSSIARS